MNKKIKIAAQLGLLSVSLPLFIMSCERKERPNSNREDFESTLKENATKLFSEIRFDYRKDKSEVFAKDVLENDLYVSNDNKDFNVVNIKLSAFGNVLKIKYSLQYRDSNIIIENSNFYEINGFKKEDKIEEIPSNNKAKILFKLNTDLDNLKLNFIGDKDKTTPQDVKNEQLVFSGLGNENHEVIIESREAFENKIIFVVKLRDKEHNFFSKTKTFVIENLKSEFISDSPSALDNTRIIIVGDDHFKNKYSKISIWYNMPNGIENPSLNWYINDKVFKENSEAVLAISVADISEDSEIYLKISYHENGEDKEYTTNKISIKKYVSEKEKIDAELEKVVVEYAQDKHTLRAQDAKASDFTYSNFDEEKYEIILLNKTYEGHTVNLSLKLKDKETGLESELKTFEVSGFLEELPTPIANSLANTRISIENDGDFGDTRTSLLVSYNGPESNGNLTFKWYLNDVLLKSATERTLSLKSNQIYKDSTVTLKILYRENKQAKQYETNTINVKRYISPREKIEAELQKVTVEYTGNKERLRVQDAELSEFRYSNYDDNKYEVVPIRKTGKGKTLNLSFILRDKQTKLQSESRIFTITGFIEELPTPIEDSLQNTAITVNNNGDFGDSTTLTVTYAAPANAENLTFKWYRNNRTFKTTTEPVLNITPADIPIDSTVYLKVLYQENKESKEYQTNAVQVKKYVSPQDKIAKELKKVNVEYNGNKNELRAQDVNESNLVYSGYDETKYRIVKLSTSGEGRTLIVRFKLEEVNSHLLSEEKQVEISGFLEKLPTPITDELNNHSIRVQNEGRFENWNSNLTLSFSNQINNHNFTYTWFKDGEAIANSNDVNLTIKSSSITKDSVFYLSISYVENDEQKTFKTNEITVYKFITAKEAIDDEIDNLEATYIGNKSRISPQNAKTSDIHYSNYNNEKYNVILISKEHDEYNLILKLKLKYKNLDIESKERTISISGFASELLDSISSILTRSNITATNGGYFGETNDRIKISFESPINLEGLSYQWYQAGLPRYKSNDDHIFINRNEIIKDTEFYLTITYSEDNQTKSYKTNTVTIRNINPLSKYELGSLNDGLIIDGSTQIYLKNYQADTDNGLYVQWFKDDKLVSDEFQNAFTVTEDGEYYALIIDQNSVKWKTNIVKVSKLQRLNKDESFASNLTDEVTITTTSSKILGYEDRTPVTQVYETTLLNEYQASGFRYPAYNFNYEGRRNENSFIRHNSQRVNISNLLLNERVKDQPNYKYNDPNWIKSEIANNRLKKHPFALNWYVENVSDSTKAVIKKFELNSNILGYNTSGLYAAAGEVIEVQFDESTYELYRKNYAKNNSVINIDFVINKSYWDNRNFNDSGRISNRYPFLISQFSFRFNDISADRKIKIGSPFGGAISFNVKSAIHDRGKPQSINFTVRNAVQTVEYIHNQTTKEDWENQLRDFKNKKITAPIFSLQTTYSSIWLPLTDVNRIAGVAVDSMVYPKEVISKWEDFYETSYLWNDYSGKKMSLNYNDDIWGNAAAWGGGDFSLYAPISWGSGYLKGVHDFNFSGWGNYHEVNHNFQNYQDPFNIRDHGWTNIPSLINLSFINDGTRHRNIANFDGSYSSGWARLANLSSIIKHDRSWYGFYGALVYTFGPINFVDYTKASGRRGFSNKGVKTTKFLSDYFEFDLDYTMRSFTWLINGRSARPNFKNALPPIKDGHIDATDKINEVNALIATLRTNIAELDQRIQTTQQALQSNPNDEEKKADLELATRLKNEKTQELEAKVRLLNSYEDRSFFGEDEKAIVEMKKKMALDIVGNIYASGSYRYIPSKDKYEYTSDTMPAFQIPAGAPYVFDFEKAISSINTNFRFKAVKFEPTTKLGGKLKLDSQNSKKLIYEANMDFIDQIDEFDVDIIPDEFSGKPENYIPAYKYKIKVRNIVNKPEVYIYNSLPANQNPANIDQVLNIVNTNENIKNNYFVIADDANGQINHVRQQKQLAIQKMKFVAPESGQFDFVAVVDDYISIEVNGTKIGELNRYVGNETKIASYTFEKDHIYNIKINYYNSGGGSSFGSRLKKGDKYYSFYDYSLPSSLNTDNLDW